MLYAQVVLPLAQPMYSFSLDESLAVEVGDAVVVQFGSSRYYTGIVWSLTTERPEYPRIKPILKRLYSTPLVTAEAQRLWEWIAEYYMCTIGEVMRVALPALAKPSATTLTELDERSIEPPTETFIALTEELRTEESLEAYVNKHSRKAPRRTATMERIAALAAERGGMDSFVPRRLVDVETQHIAELKRRALIELREAPIEATHDKNDFLLPTLSAAQQQVLEAIDRGHSSGKVALLHGVTGSGKTEIYIHLIARTLAEGRDALVLVPEIVITSQLVERLERIFEGRTTTYHSRLTPLRRGETF
ncbi:MAG: DEAD/DEAH box helicase family protein, partial [Alistipes sp.]|nr:DEAD/DEAH box helicase family protein [Alistipes sp.]